MGNIIADSWKTYITNLKLVVLFSIPFLISLLIPIFAAIPTYISAGGIFLRTASVSLNLDPFSLSIIIVSEFLSLLFVSFAFVSISLIVRSSRTRTKNPRYIIEGVEKYTSRVFTIFAGYFILIVAMNLLDGYIGTGELLTSVTGFALFFLLFFAPAGVVIDNKNTVRAVRDSVRIAFQHPAYFVMWLALIVIIISALDAIMIYFTGTVVSEYLTFFISSLFIMPYFVIFQTEAYMKRFAILRH